MTDFSAHYHYVFYCLLCFLLQLICTVVVYVYCKKMSQHFLSRQSICVCPWMTPDLTQGPRSSSLYQVIRNLNQRILQSWHSLSIYYSKSWFLVISSHISKSNNAWQSCSVLVLIQKIYHRCNSPSFHEQFRKLWTLFCHLSYDRCGHLSHSFVRIFQLVKYLRKQLTTTNGLGHLRSMFRDVWQSLADLFFELSVMMIDLLSEVRNSSSIYHTLRQIHWMFCYLIESKSSYPFKVGIRFLKS